MNTTPVLPQGSTARPADEALNFPRPDPRNDAMTAAAKRANVLARLDLEREDRPRGLHDHHLDDRLVEAIIATLAELAGRVDLLEAAS